ncbi:hypothetical protein BZZ01_09995 [Nostocales cyanobacterium HT-58-2]|nr:hypothetical protein BZZ01_09995 [Nostocales cyanobacterium HT-58-2]
MSYYNFNDHFWSPKTVCSQAAQPKSNEKNARRSQLTGILTLVCLAVWTPLLLQVIVPTKNNNQQTISLDTINSSGEHFVFKRERFLFYLSVQQR